MQTFVPYSDFAECAKVLDYRRLGKQRVEAFQIINALGRTSGGWVNHPATVMWRGYEPALKLYMNAMIEEWLNRGYRNEMEYNIIEEDIVMPYWLGGVIHRTHRAALLYKNPEHYNQFNWAETPVIDYYWPVSQQDYYASFDNSQLPF